MSFFPGTEKFWHARDAAYDRRKAASAARQKSPGNGRWFSRQERKEYLWATRGHKYLRAEPRMLARFGDFAVINDPSLSRDVMAAIERAAPLMAAIFDKRFSSLAFSAWRAWPEDTGWSRSLLALRYSADGSTFAGQLSSEAPYTYFIKGHPHKSLISVPGKAMGMHLGRDIFAIGYLTEGAR